MSSSLHSDRGPLRPDGGTMARFGQVLRESGGPIALKFAFVGPAVFLLAVGGVDLLAVSGSQARLQTIADGAAVAGAAALDPGTGPSAARSRAADFVSAQMTRWPDAPTVEARYEVVDQAGRPALRVVLRGHRPSLLANMLPPGGWHFTGDASARSI